MKLITEVISAILPIAQSINDLIEQASVIMQNAIEEERTELTEDEESVLNAKSAAIDTLCQTMIDKHSAAK